VAGSKKQWLVDVTAYTLAGGSTSMLIGACLGLLGKLILPAPSGKPEILVVVVIASLIVGRELGWLPLPLPQLKRQTNDAWGKFLPSTVVAALWGMDIGLLFTTWLTFSGVWLLVIMAILTRGAIPGAILLALYWFGRTLSTWVAPWLMPDASATSQLIDAIRRQYWLFQRIHVVGILWCIVVLSLLFVHH